MASNITVVIELQTLEAIETTHLSQIDELEQTLFELRGEIAGGRHVPPNTRILQLADNPETQWFEGRKEVVDGLRRENEGLLKRLAEFEGAVMIQDSESKDHLQGGGLVPRESWELVKREKDELEEEIKKKEKRLMRLQQVRILLCFAVLKN